MLPIGQHTLVTQPDNDGAFKHCILVKLTESSAQAIEDYLRIRDNTNKRPSIVFQKDKGEISFPIDSKSASHDSGYKKFHIAISSVKESMKQDTSASVECISFTNKFKKLGTIESKVTVQAIKDEVFQATMEKVNNVKEEEKNNSTREIKHSGAIVNRNSLGTNNQNNLRSKPFNSFATNKSLNSYESSKPKVNDRPLRERIIHLLAHKPYMKPEIMLRLKKDSPLDREIEQLDSIIQSVGVLNHKNQYELTGEVMLNEVKEDWPFYNPTEKIIVKRNIVSVKKHGNMAGSSAASSSKLNTSLNSRSSAFSSIASSNGNLNKMNLDEFKNNNGDKKSSPMKNHSENSSSGKITPNVLKQRAQMQKSSISPGSPEDKDLNLISKKPEKPDGNDFKKLKPNGNINNQRDFGDTQNMFDFSKKFKPIQTKQQLKQYTLEFEQNHREYSDLYEFLAPTAKQFDMYQKELHDIDDQTSKEATEKKDSILRVYFDKKNDLDFSKRRERYDYLDMKLNFIKNLISQYKLKNEPQPSLSPFSP